MNNVQTGFKCIALAGWMVFCFSDLSSAGELDSDPSAKVSPPVQSSPKPSDFPPPSPTIKLVRTPGGYHYYDVQISGPDQPLVLRSIVVTRYGAVWIEDHERGSERYPNHRQPTVEEASRIESYLKITNPQLWF